MGQARRRWRKHLIDVSRLLGYTIEPSSDKFGPYPEKRCLYILVRPNGNVIREVVPETGVHYEVKTFKHMWEAARHAVELEGLDAGALKPGRDA